ncbi:MAG: hypothetical protein QME25_00845 [Bacteroidota bacterium]|nr:hypothetical protein [Bacteroidota bacterium]
MFELRKPPPPPVACPMGGRAGLAVWDNPNVFQLCTLNETKSELKKQSKSSSEAGKDAM